MIQWYQNMEIFDGKNKEWSYDSQIENFVRFNREINFNSDKKLDLCNLNVIHQIGTPSTMAQVFKVKINVENLTLAAKILPICADNSFKNNEKEMKYAIQASELKSIYFLKIFDIAYCIDTGFNFGDDKKFKYNWEIKSLNYQQLKFLLDKFSHSPKILEKIKRMRKNLIPIDVISNQIDKSIILPNAISSHIIFSEILPYDLKYLLQYQKEKLNYIQWYIFIKHLLTAIYEMHVILGIFHTDLHLGNVLVYKSENLFIPVIHDFGKSIDYDKKQYLHRYSDISTIISHIQDVPEIIPENIMKYLDDLSDIFMKLVDEEDYPIQKLNSFWNNIKF